MQSIHKFIHSCRVRFVDLLCVQYAAQPKQDGTHKRGQAPDQQTKFSSSPWRKHRPAPLLHDALLGRLERADYRVLWWQVWSLLQRDWPLQENCTSRWNTQHFTSLKTKWFKVFSIGKTWLKVARSWRNEGSALPTAWGCCTLLTRRGSCTSGWTPSSSSGLSWTGGEYSGGSFPYLPLEK